MPLETAKGALSVRSHPLASTVGISRSVSPASRERRSLDVVAGQTAIAEPRAEPPYIIEYRLGGGAELFRLLPPALRRSKDATIRLEFPMRSCE